MENIFIYGDAIKPFSIEIKSDYVCIMYAVNKNHII